MYVCIILSSIVSWSMFNYQTDFIGFGKNVVKVHQTFKNNQSNSTRKLLPAISSDMNKCLDTYYYKT